MYSAMTFSVVSERLRLTRSESRDMSAETNWKWNSGQRTLNREEFFSFCWMLIYVCDEREGDGAAEGSWDVFAVAI